MTSAVRVFVALTRELLLAQAIIFAFGLAVVALWAVAM